MSNIAIIGGGASGLMAAICAAKKPSNTVTIYEGQSRAGKKILATGNGRCNMTNIFADTDHYHGGVDFMKYAVDTFWVDKTLDFFTRLGIVYKVEDEGKVYPYSNQASAVLDVLRFEAKRLGVNIITGFEVNALKKKGGGFLITSYDKKTAYADKAVIATGGKAAPDLGSNGSGYALLKAFGHKITDVSPSLVQIKTEGDVCKKLKGIKTDAVVTLGKNKQSGEVLFTDYGLSGPSIFYLSAYLNDEEYLSLDIMSEYSFGDIVNIIRGRIKNNGDTLLEDFFVGMLNKRIGQVLLKEAGIAPLSRTAKTLTDAEIKKVSMLIKDWRFIIAGTMSWNNAQVTRGGAVTEEFDPKTMESKLVSGLYAVGEVLDIDGDCGGYNLQWAWTSGYIAGTSV